jgi:hypothetical protein
MVPSLSKPILHVGEMGHVDVVAHARHAPKRHGSQRARAGDVIE